MTRGRYYGTVMPIWAILYVIGIIVFKNHTFNIVGALVFALLAVIGTVVIRPDPNSDRAAGRAARRAARRS